MNHPDLPARRSQGSVRVFLCGDVMTGHGIDQVLPYPCDSRLHERYVESATDYVRLAEDMNGPIPRSVDFSYIWGVELDEFRRLQPDARIINLETSITHNDAYEPKGINYRMSAENAGCLAAAAIDCCVLANNHVADWGRDGLLETLETLEQLRIKCAWRRPHTGRYALTGNLGDRWQRTRDRVCFRFDDKRCAPALGREEGRRWSEFAARSILGDGY